MLTTTRRAVVLAVSLMLLATATAACSRTVDADPSAPAVVKAGWPGCRATGAFDDASQAGPTTTGSIPPGFRPTTAILCTQSHQPEGKPKLVNVERRATELQPLLDYLARPSQRSTRPDTVACQAMAWAPPWLFLVDDTKRWITPQVPTDPCGFALQLFEDPGPPYENLTYTDRVIG